MTIPQWNLAEGTSVSISNLRNAVTGTIWVFTLTYHVLK